MTKTANLIGELSKDGKTIYLKEPLHEMKAGNVHILVIQEDDSIDEIEWLKNSSSAFPELSHPGEDIYTVKDGTPYYDKG
jgi:hypothetical protein